MLMILLTLLAIFTGKNSTFTVLPVLTKLRQYYDFLKILELGGSPSKNRYSKHPLIIHNKDTSSSAISLTVVLFPLRSSSYSIASR